MKEFLEELNQIPGVRGIAVISKDGLIIEKIFYDNRSGKYIGAMVARISSEMEDAFGKGTDSIPIFVTLYAQQGELVFLTMGDFIVCVLSDKKTNLGAISIKIKEIANKIKDTIK